MIHLILHIQSIGLATIKKSLQEALMRHFVCLFVWIKSEIWHIVYTCSTWNWPHFKCSGVSCDPSPLYWTVQVWTFPKPYLPLVSGRPRDSFSEEIWVSLPPATLCCSLFTSTHTWGHSHTSSRCLYLLTHLAFSLLWKERAMVNPILSRLWDWAQSHISFFAESSPLRCH